MLVLECLQEVYQGIDNDRVEDASILESIFSWQPSDPTLHRLQAGIANQHNGLLCQLQESQMTSTLFGQKCHLFTMLKDMVQ